MTDQTVEQRLKEAIELVEGMPEHERGTYANNNLDFARALNRIMNMSKVSTDDRANEWGIGWNNALDRMKEIIQISFSKKIKEDTENIIEEELNNHD